MFGRGIPIAKLFGIRIEIDLSWLFVFALVSWTLADRVFPEEYPNWSEGTAWTVGIVAALLLFGTVLLHELAHALVAKARGLTVPKISLFIFGGVSHLGRQPSSAREEFSIAAAGPATSILIAGASIGIAFAASGRNEYLEAIFSYLGFVNGVLAAFNLLPGFPLDGGRVLRSIIWGRTRSFRRATEVASGVGVAFGYGLLFAGLGFILFGYLINGIWFAFIGWFLMSAARAEGQSVFLESVLARLRARDVMSTDFAVVPPGMSLAQVVDEYMVSGGHRAVVVALGDQVEGILTVSDVRRYPRAEWPHIPARQAMTPKERVITVDASTPAIQVLMLVGQNRLNQVPVLEDGRMVGLITRRELLDRVQLAGELAANGTAEANGPTRA
ncbi:Putative zinc metalloprotease Rip3 [bacterium HR29]|jgi:Zn-dependent protease/CBS domain-containing protein|nr:Putative zinc metalloprotease Rip3 [bacterium HR29]